MDDIYQELVSGVFVPLIMGLTVIIYVCIALIMLFIVLGMALLKKGRRENSRKLILSGKVFIGVGIGLAILFLFFFLRTA